MKTISLAALAAFTMSFFGFAAIMAEALITNDTPTAISAATFAVLSFIIANNPK